MEMTIQPVVGMYFSAIRNRDDKVFVGQIEKVQSVNGKGTMIVVKLDGPKYASVYLDECYDYAWSDFPLPELRGRLADERLAGIAQIVNDECVRNGW